MASIRSALDRLNSGEEASAKIARVLFVVSLVCIGLGIWLRPGDVSLRSLLTSRACDLGFGLFVMATISFVLSMVQGDESEDSIVGSIAQLFSDIRLFFHRDWGRFLRPVSNFLTANAYFTRDYTERFDFSPNGETLLKGRTEISYRVQSLSTKTSTYQMHISSYGLAASIGTKPSLRSCLVEAREAGNDSQWRELFRLNQPLELEGVWSNKFDLPPRGEIRVEYTEEDVFANKDFFLLTRLDAVDGIRLIVSFPQAYEFEAYPIHAGDKAFDHTEADGKNEYRLTNPMLPGNGYLLEWRPARGS